MSTSGSTGVTFRRALPRPAVDLHTGKSDTQRTISDRNVSIRRPGPALFPIDPVRHWRVGCLRVLLPTFTFWTAFNQISSIPVGLPKRRSKIHCGFNSHVILLIGLYTNYTERNSNLFMHVFKEFSPVAFLISVFEKVFLQKLTGIE